MSNQTDRRFLQLPPVVDTVSGLQSQHQRCPLSFPLHKGRILIETLGREEWRRGRGEKSSRLQSQESTNNASGAGLDIFEVEEAEVGILVLFPPLSGYGSSSRSLDLSGRHLNFSCPCFCDEGSAAESLF